MAVNLVIPTWATIQPWDSSKQKMDDPAREPVHGARGGPTLKMPVQIKWNRRGAPQYNAAGVVPKSDGYIIVRRIDMKARGIMLKRGDKIIQLGLGPNATAGLSLYITDEVPMGHVAGGGAELAKFNFEDRNPGRTP